MDGRCQDGHLHCTDPLQGGERVNITFRSIRNHVPRFFLAAGVMCCLPACVKGSSVSTKAGFFLPGFSVLAILLVFFRVIALFPINLGLQRRTSRCTRLLGGERRGFGCCGSVQNSGGKKSGGTSGDNYQSWYFWMRNALVWNRLPSLLSSDVRSVLRLRGALQRNNGQKQSET